MTDRDGVHPPASGDVEVSLARAPTDRPWVVLVVVNVCPRVIRLPGKPEVVPARPEAGEAGRRAVTLEFVAPGYVDLRPGQRARADVVMQSDGDTFLVQLGDHGDPTTLHRVVLTGIPAPAQRERESAWFRLVDEDGADLETRLIVRD